MNGIGVVKALGVAMKHFIKTYLVDLKAIRSGKKREKTVNRNEPTTLQ